MSAFTKVLILFQFIILFLPNIDSSVPKIDATNSSNVTNGCIPKISQSAMKFILKLMSDKITHVIDLNIWIESVNNTMKKTWMLTGIKWANEIGRTLITLVAEAKNTDNIMLLSYTSTMKAGHHDVNIVITEDTMQCLFSRDNASDHALFDLLVHELHHISEGKTDYKLCLPFKEQDPVTKYNCCAIIGPNDALTCSDYSSVVTEMVPILVLITLVFFIYIAFPITWEYLNKFKKSDTHYRISNSPMSISSILYSVFIKGHESEKSTTRKLMFAIFVLVTTLPEQGVFLWIYLGIMSPWYFFLLTNVIRYEESRLLELTEVIYLHKWGIFSWHKFLQFIFQLKNNCAEFEEKTEETPHERLGFIKKCFISFSVSLIHLFFSPIFLAWCVLSIAISLLCIFLALVKKIVCFPKNANVMKGNTLKQVCLIIPIKLINVVIIGYSAYNVLSLVFYFVIGLFLNAEIYSPYVLPLGTVVFYSWTKWRSSVETKYLVLITNIYKVCKESCVESNERSNNVTKNSCTFGDSNQCTNLYTIELDDGEPIISKKLYDKVRKKISPYRQTLFHYYKGVFFIAVFGYLLYILMSMAQTSGIPGSIQIISTISVTSAPFIFDFVWKKKSDEQKEADSIALNSKLKGILKVCISNDTTGLIVVEFTANAKTPEVVKGSKKCFNLECCV